MLLPGLMVSQITGDEIPKAASDFLLSNIQIKTQPGDELIRADVHIVDGVIAEIGEDIQVKRGAKVIEGDELILYAAFISALSHLGQPEEEDDARRSAWRGPPGATPLEQSGLTPHMFASTDYDPGESDLKKYHQQGFGLVHSVPRGFVMPGKGSLYLLTDPADGKVNTLLKRETGLFAQFRNMRRVYPATPLATMSVWREVITDVRYQKDYWEKWNENPKGLSRPSVTELDKALFPVVSGEQPVFFHTGETRQALRAMNLANELNFKVVLANAGRLNDDFLAGLHQGIKILPNLDFPDKPDEEKEEEKGESEAEEREQDEESEEDPEEEKDELPAGMDKEEYEHLKERRKLAWEEQIMLSKKAHEQEALGGFSTLSVGSGDILSAVRLLHEKGMSEDELLEALTTLPAELFGMEGTIGKVKEGYQAHLVLFDGPFTGEDAKPTFLIVDGHLHDLRENDD